MKMQNIWGFAILNLVLVTNFAPIPSKAAEGVGVYFQPKRAIRLEGGEQMKVKADTSSDASQCFIQNSSDRVLELNSASTLGAVSYEGRSKRTDAIHDWSFTTRPNSRLTVHCEFPRGVTHQTLIEEANRVLKGYIRVVGTAQSPVASR